MEKDIGKIKKNETTDIVVRIDDFGGKVGLTIREFTTSDRYTGFTKSGTRIPVDSFKEFKQVINSIDEKDLEVKEGENKKASRVNKGQKTLKETEEKDSSEYEEESE